MTIFLGWLSRANSLRSGSGLKLKCLEAGEDRTCIKSYLYSWCRGCILNIPGLFFQSGKFPHPHHKKNQKSQLYWFSDVMWFFLWGGEYTHNAPFLYVVSKFTENSNISMGRAIFVPLGKFGPQVNISLEAAKKSWRNVENYCKQIREHIQTLGAQEYFFLKPNLCFFQTKKQIQFSKDPTGKKICNIHRWNNKKHTKQHIYPSWSYTSRGVNLPLPSFGSRILSMLVEFVLFWALDVEMP